MVEILFEIKRKQFLMCPSSSNLSHYMPVINHAICTRFHKNSLLCPTISFNIQKWTLRTCHVLYIPHHRKHNERIRLIGKFYGEFLILSALGIPSWHANYSLEMASNYYTKPLFSLTSSLIHNDNDSREKLSISFAIQIYVLMN